MSINVKDSISTINLQKIYDYLKMLKTELECANDVCKEIDNWSYWLPHNINDIKDDLWTKRQHIDEFMEELTNVIHQRGIIYCDYDKYLANNKKAKVIVK